MSCNVHSFEVFCSDAGMCPQDIAMLGESSYCLQRDEVLTVERLPNRNETQPLVQHQRTHSHLLTHFPGELGFSTYWRPKTSAVGNSTCFACSPGSPAASECHSLGVNTAKNLPHKQTPHGKQHYTIGGGSDGYIFVVMDPVSLDPLRSSYMTAWVHVGDSAWQSGDTTALDGAFVNVWATVLLVNGSVTDVHLLRTEGQDIHTLNWNDGPNKIVEGQWLRYTADLPDGTQLATMKFGADVPDPRASVWFDNLEILCKKSL